LLALGLLLNIGIARTPRPSVRRNRGSHVAKSEAGAASGTSSSSRIHASTGIDSCRGNRPSPYDTPSPELGRSVAETDSGRPERDRLRLFIPDFKPHVCAAPLRGLDSSAARICLAIPCPLNSGTTNVPFIPATRGFQSTAAPHPTGRSPIPAIRNV